MSLYPGLYEQVINNDLTHELAEIPDACKAVAPIDKAEASKVLAQYLADVVQKGLDNVLDNGGDISAQIALANRIVGLIQNTTCLLYTSPSPRDSILSRMPSSA